MFRERMGVSFYAESSFALFQHGGVEGLMGKLNDAFDGKNTKVNDMMKGSKACQDAKGTCYVIQAKVAEVMSDVGLTDEQITKLNKVALGKGVNQQLVTKIIEALGRTGSPKAVAQKGHAQPDRMSFKGAIARIGDRKGFDAETRSNKQFLSTRRWATVPMRRRTEFEIRRFTLENRVAGDDIAEPEKCANPRKTQRPCDDRAAGQFKVFDK